MPWVSEFNHVGPSAFHEGDLSKVMLDLHACSEMYDCIQLGSGLS